MVEQWLAEMSVMLGIMVGSTVWEICRRGSWCVDVYKREIGHNIRLLRDKSISLVIIRF